MASSPWRALHALAEVVLHDGLVGGLVLEACPRYGGGESWEADGMRASIGL